MRSCATEELGIYSKNTAEWIVIEHACYSHAIIPVPFYDTLLADGVEYVVNQVEITTVFTSADLVPNVLEAKKNCPSLKYIIQAETPIDSALATAAQELGVKIFSVKDVEAEGAAHPHPHSAPSPRDIASFCYTSGTTGDPKGALITHENFVSNYAAGRRAGLNTFPDDIHLSYLPLPHMFERMVCYTITNAGACIGFYQGDTLKIVEDLNALRPTIFPSVPRLLNRIHDRLIMGVNEAGGMKKTLFDKALAAKLEGLKHGTNKHALWDRLVFNAVKSKVGLDRLRLLITGSAPISDTVLNFLRAVFGVPVLEGYGLTEATLAISLTALDDFQAGTVGSTLSCCEMRLQDVPDMNYLHTDRVHGKEKMPCNGRGEVCVRGPNVFQGYYKMPEKSAEAVDADGWLHTGDIGILLPDGRLKLVDRKKNIFKLAQGEYVAVEKIENLLLQSPFVMQIFVHGDSLKTCLVMIVILDPDYTNAWALQNGKGGKSLSELTTDPDLRAIVMKTTNDLAHQHKLAGFEIPKAIYLEAVPWTAADILTPTFKMQRKKAVERYMQQIDDMYAKVDSAQGQSKL
eukprot:GEMP01013956.1.p1 GENE.GEMP01013956.1~~GEMP01013956.1.p1  ORF type:complete len:573 (+),score=115.09 GEMP01013956.1:442-2160(+)